jgi:hypothetical protein
MPHSLLATGALLPGAAVALLLPGDLGVAVALGLPHGVSGVGAPTAAACIQ